MIHPVRGSRMAWPDVAKGISILGVVMLHVSLTVPDGKLTWLAQINTVIDPLRLPLFFVVSGFFSVKVLRMSFAELFTRRLWFFLVPYLCWGLVELHTNSLLYLKVFGYPVRSLGEDLGILALGHSMGWFLHSLILYNCFLWLIRKLPVWQGLVLSFFPLLVLGFAESLFAVGKAVMFLPVFVVGALLRNHIHAFAEAIDSWRNPTWKTYAAYTVAIGGFCAGRVLRDGWDHRPTQVLQFPWITPGTHSIGTPEIYLMLRATEQTLELPMAIAAAVLIARIATLSAVFQFIGRHTLVIYLAHPIALTVGFGFLYQHFAWDIALEGAFPFKNTYFWIAFCFGISALGAVALWGIEKVPFLGWSVKPPSLVRFQDLALVRSPQSAARTCSGKRL